MKTRASSAYLCLAAAVGAAYFVLPTTPVSKLLLYNGIGLSAVLAVIVGIRRNKPVNARPWWLIAVGQTAFLSADIVYYILEATQDAVPFPSPADVLYLSMYPFVIAGLALLLRQMAPGRDLASLMDASLVAVATFTILGILYIDDYVTDSTLTLAGRLISLSYPVLDVALLAVAVRLASAVHLQNRSFLLICAGIVSLLIADATYGVLNSAGAFATGGFADAFWLGFYALVAAAALHPAMAHPFRVRDAAHGRLSFGRLGLLCLVTLAVPVIDLFWGEPFDKILTNMASMIMFLLVLGRLLLLMFAVKTREALARYDAEHDGLTGLANRMLFSERVAIALAGSDGQRTFVLFVDLDDFKTINDSLGHHVGDELLVEAALRMTSCVRPTDVVARLGGDEFAVLVDGAVDRDDAAATADRVLRSLSEPFEIAGREVLISASVGISVGGASSEGVDDLLRGADAAMYLAKKKGKGCFEFFEQHMQAEAVDRLDLRRDLQLALERNELEIYYQPIMNMAEERVHTVEALLRWNHPERGQVQPDKFIPLAEQMGLIVPIGSWVLRTATAQVKQWQQDDPGAPIGVCVNLSVRQLHSKGLLEDVAESLWLSGLAPEDLTLEITESMLLEDTERSARALAQLKALRVRIAIDDFGTGYSSLSYLRQFPFDTIKIDRSFVRELGSSPASEALVRTVIELAKSLRMDTVAEGIEEIVQRDMLADLNCGLGQGFLYSRPLTVSAMTTLLEDRKLSAAAAAAASASASTSASVKMAKPARADRPQRVEERGPAPSVGSTRRSRRRLESELHLGYDALLELRADLDDLHDAVGVPLTATMSWLTTLAEIWPESVPEVLVIREPGRGRIDAAAMLAATKRNDSVEFNSIGINAASTTRFPARNAGAARALAAATAEHITKQGEWTVLLSQLPPHDPVAKMLLNHLPNAYLVEEQSVPLIEFSAATSMETLLSHNLRRQLRKARNRIDNDGLAMDISFETRFNAVEPLLDELEAVHIARDHETGRRSDLDDPVARKAWRALIARQARAGRVEVGTLRLDGAVAAYVIAMVDGTSYRVFDGHFDSAFSRFSPGRIIEAEVTERAMRNGFAELDWMSGMAPEKILAVNGFQPRAALVAGSHATSARRLVDSVKAPIPESAEAA